MMNRKSLLTLFLSVSTSLLATHAALAGREGSGGGGVGNGGGSWTCRANTPGHELIWVDLVDLSEGWRELGLNIPSLDPVAGNRLTQDDWLAQAEAKIQKANPAFYAEYQRYIKGVKDRFTQPRDSDFDRTSDINHRTRPNASTCPGGTVSAEPEQLANFTQIGTLIVNPELWNSPKLLNIGRAALLAHEAIYWMLRQPSLGGDKDSQRAREIVAYLFSDAPVEKYASLLPTPPAPSTLPAPVAPPSVQPHTGLYGEILARMADIEITAYDPSRHLLYLNQRDRDDHEALLSSSTFRCGSDGAAVACVMIASTSARHRNRGFTRYQLRFDAENTFAWMTWHKDGSVQVTRYNKLR